MMCAARTQIRNGKCLLCIIVPAIIDVCRAQPAHSQVARFRLNGQPLQVPQEGHAKPSSQRCSARQCEHASSPENLASNAGRDMGVSFFHLAGMGRTIPRTLQIGKPLHTTSSAAGAKGISLTVDYTKPPKDVFDTPRNLTNSSHPCWAGTYILRTFEVEEVCPIIFVQRATT